MSGKRILICFIVSAVLALNSICQVSSQPGYEIFTEYESMFRECVRNDNDYRTLMQFPPSEKERNSMPSSIKPLHTEIRAESIYVMLYSIRYINQRNKKKVDVLFYLKYLVNYVSVCMKLTKKVNLDNPKIEKFPDKKYVLENDVEKLIFILDYYLAKNAKYTEFFELLSEWYLKEQRESNKGEEAEKLVTEARKMFEIFFNRKSTFTENGPSIYDQFVVVNAFITAILPNAFIPSTTIDLSDQKILKLKSDIESFNLLFPDSDLGNSSKTLKVIKVLIKFLGLDKPEPPVAPGSSSSSN